MWGTAEGGSGAAFRTYIPFGESVTVEPFPPHIHHLKGESTMSKVKLNPDAAVVAMIKEGLKAKDGYCPCRLQKTPENKCICQEFRDQIADPEFEGFCHCMLYYKD